MDAFRRGALLMLGSARGVSAEYRAKGTGVPVPCRILFYREPDDTARPGVTGGRLVACGHFATGMDAVVRTDTFLVAGKVHTVDQRPPAEPGWDWRAFLQEGV